MAVERAQQASLGNRRSFQPEIDGQFDPARHRDGAQAVVFAAQVDDDPAAVALLHVLGGKCHRFAAAQAAADQQGQHGAIPFAFQGGGDRGG